MSIDIDIPFISGFLDEVEKKLSFTIPIQTDLLNAIDQLIYRTEFNTVLSNNEQRGIFLKIFNLNMYKNAYSNIVNVNLTSLRMNIPCIDINLGERLEWNTLCQPCSIQASKHFIITWNWLKELLVKQFIFKDKEEFEMYANSFKLGNINVEKISERKLGLLLTGCKQTTYNIIMKFGLTDFDKILHCHIIQDEETTFTIPDLGISFTFDKKIADMLPEISPITDPLQWDEVRNFLSHLQSLAFGGILGIILLILYDYIWKKIFMKKQ